MTSRMNVSDMRPVVDTGTRRATLEGRISNLNPEKMPRVAACKLRHFLGTKICKKIQSLPPKKIENDMHSGMQSRPWRRVGEVACHHLWYPLGRKPMQRVGVCTSGFTECTVAVLFLPGTERAARCWTDRAACSPARWGSLGMLARPSSRPFQPDGSLEGTWPVAPGLHVCLPCLFLSVPGCTVRTL